MEAIGLLLVNFLYLIFFIGYFIFSYSLYKNLVLPYFSINMIILLIEFFTLSGSHKTFTISILFNIIYLFYITFENSKATKKDRKILQRLAVIALSPYFLIFIVSYASKLNIIFSFLVLHNTYFLFFFLIFMLLLIIIQFKRILLNRYMVGITFFVYIVIAFSIMTYNIENNIKNISIEKFGIAPQCLNINFDIYDDFRHPHALVKKDEKYYYWSFRENNFIENNNIQGC